MRHDFDTTLVAIYARRLNEMLEFQELIPQIEGIITFEQGTVLFNKALNNVISNPVLMSIRDWMGNPQLQAS